MGPSATIKALWASVQGNPGLSLWALVSGHWAAWQAARVEVTQQAEEEARQVHPAEERVVDAIVERTTIEAT